MSRNPRGRRPRTINPSTARLTGGIDPAVGDKARCIYKQIIRSEYAAVELTENDRANIRQRVTDQMNSSGYYVTLRQVEIATACLRSRDPGKRDRPVKLPPGLNDTLGAMAKGLGVSKKDLATQLILRGLAASDPMRLKPV